MNRPILLTVASLTGVVLLYATTGADAQACGAKRGQCAFSATVETSTACAGVGAEVFVDDGWYLGKWHQKRKAARQAQHSIVAASACSGAPACSGPAGCEGSKPASPPPAVNSCPCGPTCDCQSGGVCTGMQMAAPPAPR